MYEHKITQPDEKHAQEHLDIMCRSGWQVVAAWPVNHGLLNRICFVLRRPVPTEPVVNITFDGDGIKVESGEQPVGLCAGCQDALLVQMPLL